jgi:hypothetical protein
MRWSIDVCDVLTCRCVDVLMRRCVDVLMCWWLCWRVDVLKYWCVDDCVGVLVAVLMIVLMCWCSVLTILNLFHEQLRGITTSCDELNSRQQNFPTVVEIWPFCNVFWIELNWYSFEHCVPWRHTDVCVCPDVDKSRKNALMLDVFSPVTSNSFSLAHS